MQSSTNDCHHNHLDEGLLIDLDCPDDAVKVPDHLVGFSATMTESQNRDFPIPFDLRWDDIPHQSLPELCSTDSLPSNFSSLSPTAPVYVPKSLSPLSNAESLGASAYRPLAKSQPARTSSNHSISTLDYGRPSTPERFRFKTYADVSNYFYSSKDRTILETPLSSHAETSPAPSIPTPHHRGSSESSTQPVEQEEHISSRPNWATFKQDQTTENLKNKSSTICTAHTVSRTVSLDLLPSKTPQHPLPVSSPRNDGQPAVHSLSNSKTKQLVPPVQTFTRTHVAGDPWVSDLPFTWNLKLRGDIQNLPSRSSPTNYQYADATNVSQPFNHHQVEVPQLTLVSQPRQFGGSQRDDQFEYKSSGALFDDRSRYQHHKLHLIPLRQDDMAPGAKNLAPLDVWESSDFSAFEVSAPGTPGWERSIAHQTSKFNDLSMGEHGWVSSDEPAWNAPGSLVEMPNRQMHPPPASPRPRLPVGVFWKRNPDFVLPSPNQETSLNTT